MSSMPARVQLAVGDSCFELDDFGPASVQLAAGGS